MTPDASFGPIGKFFNVIFYFISITRRPSTHPPLACKYEPGVGLLTTTTTTTPTTTTTTPPSSLANGHLTPQRSLHTTTTNRSPHLTPPTATTRHVTSPTFSNRAGKTKKGEPSYPLFVLGVFFP